MLAGIVDRTATSEFIFCARQCLTALQRSESQLSVQCNYCGVQPTNSQFVDCNTTSQRSALY